MRDRDLVRWFLIKIDPVDILVHLSKPLLAQIILQRRTILTHGERALLDRHELHADGVGDGLDALALGIHQLHGKGEKDREQAVSFHVF